MSKEVRTKAVIFDLDDTLIAEKQYIESGYNHIAEILSHDINRPQQKIFDMMLNLSSINHQNVFNKLLDEYKVQYTDEDISKLVEAYRNHEPKISFFDDVLPCLKLLKEKRVKTGIITDGYLSAQRNKLKTLGADKIFDYIIMTDELGREFWKPSARAFEIMRDKLDVEFNEMIYIGDNPKKDFHIGKIYPICTVRIQREGIFNNEDYLDDIKENYLIHNLIELQKLLEL